MAIAAINRIFRFFRPSRLTGPVFDKELRVASRRRWNYILRFAYVAALTGVVILNWGDLGGLEDASAGYVISRMSEAGKNFISTVVVFQFWVMHFLAAVLMGTAVREEVQRRTLGVLMTVPMTGWQFVTGKLLSKLLGIVVLLACSLPVLAIVRLFGGVPWEYVISSLAITLAATVLVGSISLHASFRAGDPVSVFVRTLLVYGLLFVALPVFLIPNSIAAHVSPFMAMRINNALLLDPSSFLGAVSFNWVAHCLLILALSALFLAAAASRVRQVGLKALEQGDSTSPRRKQQNRPAIAGLRGAREATRRVHGSPLIWKELRFYLPGSRTRTILSVSVLIALLVLTYVSSMAGGLVEPGWGQVYYVFLYFGTGVVVTTCLAGAAISDERRSRSLPLLLSLPVSDNHIIFAKALGVFYRASPLWLLLGLHVVVFTALGYVHPIFLLHVGVLTVWTVIFTTGVGLYFSSLFRSGTSAALVGLGLGLFLWLIMPFLAGPAFERRGGEIRHVCLRVNPFVQLYVCAEAASGSASARKALGDLEYNWRSYTSGAADATLAVMISLIAYSSAGLIFAWLARRRLRTSLF